MILFNDFQRQWLDTGEDTLEAVRCVGRRGWYILGEEVAQFETALAQMWGVKHAVGVASGLDALEIALVPVLPLVEVERRAICDALRITAGDRTAAARLLGIGRTTIYRKLKEFRA